MNTCIAIHSKKQRICNAMYSSEQAEVKNVNKPGKLKSVYIPLFYGGEWNFPWWLKSKQWKIVWTRAQSTLLNGVLSNTFQNRPFLDIQLRLIDLTLWLSMVWLILNCIHLMFDQSWTTFVADLPMQCSRSLAVRLNGFGPNLQVSRLPLKTSLLFSFSTNQKSPLLTVQTYLIDVIDNRK